MRQILLALLVVALCGCQSKQGKIKSGGVEVVAVGDAGKPGQLNTSDAKESLPLAAGSTIVVRKKDAVPATDKTPFLPAEERTEVKLNGPSIWTRAKNEVAANTGTVDTSVALKKVEAAESRPLLYAAIGAALMAGFFLYRAYPTPAFICGGAAVALFMAWKVSGLPDWFWAVGACAIVGAIALYLGHERGEKANVVAGTPVTPVPAPTAVPPTFSPTATPNAPTP